MASMHAGIIGNEFFTQALKEQLLDPDLFQNEVCIYEVFCLLTSIFCICYL